MLVICGVHRSAERGQSLCRQGVSSGHTGLGPARARADLSTVLSGTTTAGRTAQQVLNNQRGLSRRLRRIVLSSCRHSSTHTLF